MKARLAFMSGNEVVYPDVAEVVELEDKVEIIHAQGVVSIPKDNLEMWETWDVV